MLRTTSRFFAFLTLLGFVQCANADITVLAPNLTKTYRYLPLGLFQ